MNARIERISRERTERRRERIEGLIAHLRRKPLKTRFATEIAPEFGALMEELKQEGAQNAVCYQSGEPRSRPYEETPFVSLAAEAAAFKRREDYPPGLERELQKAAAEREPVLSAEERRLVAEMRDLRRLGCHSLVQGTYASERAAELLQHPSDSVRLEASETWLAINFGEPEAARYPERRLFP